MTKIISVRRIRSAAARNAGVTFALFLPLALQSHAQEEKQGRVLEEVIVTAGKRSQSISEIAGSISAMTGDQLENMQAKSMEDYLKQIPGVALPTGQFGVDSSPPVIRGIAATTGFGNIGAPGSQTTGVFIDDIPFGTSLTSIQFPDVNPFDLERVEVLKGPQGTLFGAQALAGAIRYITQKPELGAWQAKFQGSLTDIEGSDENYNPFAALALNIPIGENAAIRAVGLYRELGGFIDVVSRGDPPAARTEKDVNSISQRAERILAKWQVNDRLTLSASYFLQDSEQYDFSASDKEDELERALTPYRIPTESTFGLTNFVIEYEFDWATFLSSTSRKKQESGINPDITGGIGSGIGGTSCNSADPNAQSGPCDNPGEGPGLEDQDTLKLVNVDISNETVGYSQEFRLVSPDDGRWLWIAGASAQRDKVHAFQVTDLATIAGQPLVSGTPILESPFGPINLNAATRFQSADAESIAKEVSVFGDLTRRLWDRWEVTVGGRYYRTSLDSTVTRRTVAQNINEYEDGLQNPATIGDFLTNFSTVTVRKPESEERGFNPKVSVRFDLADNITTYALAAKGFQFGGTQLGAPLPTTQVPESYDSSTLWNYEIGMRSDWFDRRVSVDATVFYMDWEDLQLRGATPDPSGLRLISSYYVTNVGAAESKGIELSLRVIPHSSLMFTSSASKMEAVTAEEFVDAETQQTIESGSRLPASPEFQITNMLSYEPQLNVWQPSLTLTHTYIGESFNNIIKDQEIGDYHTYDANLRIRNIQSRFQPSVTLSVTNISDTRGVANADGNASRRGINWVYIRPRTIELTFAIRFE